ncbi:MAG: tRNA (adenosine(37)-N6)-dimethylallyltransferase MiaA [Campylobacterota bacterium]|nr:tRNA (adenosine(37)-N6)-dimethylallyltransferase MiaA [Campylobacterota bacterium]
MKTIAIIGPTASGKSDLALKLALEHNAYILSIDSLSIYKEIDIASAKPSADELALVRHFGINVLAPNEHFSVSTFIDCYHDARQSALQENKNLIIVGGTGFYLKSLLSGLSPLPAISDATKLKAASFMNDLPSAYSMLQIEDPEHMQSIAPTDVYRIEKMLLLYLESGMTPSAWFNAHPPEPIITDLPLFEIDVERSVLRGRIKTRTHKMVELGLIDEVAGLELHYGRSPNSMKAIGIIEVLEYLDGLSTKDEMIEKVITHTAQLAKRQQTFNRHQFNDKRVCPIPKIYEEAGLLLQ